MSFSCDHFWGYFLKPLIGAFFQGLFWALYWSYFWGPIFDMLKKKRFSKVQKKVQPQVNLKKKICFKPNIYIFI